MGKIKESSMIQANKQTASAICPISYFISKMGGYWKPIIIYQLINGERRYNELRRAIPAITEKMLIQNLKQLEADNIITRTALPTVPPHVTYRLTASGAALLPVVEAISIWAQQDSR